MADSPIKMEAHGVTSVISDEPATSRAHDTRGSPRRQRPAPDKDPFQLGFGYRLRTTVEGREVVEQTPLAAADLAYPQEGDVVSDGYPHNTGLQPRADSLRRHLEKRGATLVTSNVMLVLSDGRNCSPDIAVIEGEIDRSKIERSVKLRELGGRLVFALEVVSTSAKAIEDKDLKVNMKRYAKEGVRDYFTVYPIVERQVKNLVGRRLKKGDYVKLPPDAQKRVYSKELDLFFQIDAESKELVAIDAQTGQRLLISDEEEAGRKKAEAERDVAEKRAEQAEQGLRRNVKDLCGLLGIEWNSERSTAVADMDSSRLETLWTHLMSRKRWP